MCAEAVWWRCQDVARRGGRLNALSELIEFHSIQGGDQNA